MLEVFKAVQAHERKVSESIDALPRRGGRPEGHRDAGRRPFANVRGPGHGVRGSPSGALRPAIPFARHAARIVLLKRGLEKESPCDRGKDHCMPKTAKKQKP